MPRMYCCWWPTAFETFYGCGCLRWQPRSLRFLILSFSRPDSGCPIAWSCVFASINLFQSWRLYVERRPVKLTSEEEEVRRLAFENLPPVKVLQVLSIGSWFTAETGEQVIRRGEGLGTISLIVRGSVRLTRGEAVLGNLVAGNLLGSALLLDGNTADVDVVAIGPVRG